MDLSKVLSCGLIGLAVTVMLSGMATAWPVELESPSLLEDESWLLQKMQPLKSLQLPSPPTFYRLPSRRIIGGLAGKKFGTPISENITSLSWEGPYESELMGHQFLSYAEPGYTNWEKDRPRVPTQLMLVFCEDKLTQAAFNFRPSEEGVDGLWELALYLRSLFIRAYGVELVQEDRLQSDKGYLYIQDEGGRDVAMKWDRESQLLLVVARDAWLAKLDPMLPQLEAEE